MFITDVIRIMWCGRQLYKLEKRSTFCKRSKLKISKNRFKFETKKARAARLAKERERYEAMVKESKERLALLLLSDVIGDVDRMNEVCDIIKQCELVDGYK